MYLSNNHDTIERHRAVIIQVVYWGLILGGLYLGYRYLLPVLFPFIIAFLLAAMMNRPVSYLQKKAHLPRVRHPSFLHSCLRGLSSGFAYCVEPVSLQVSKALQKNCQPYLSMR